MISTQHIAAVNADEVKREDLLAWLRLLWAAAKGAVA